MHDMDLALGRRCAMHMGGRRSISRMFRCLANGLFLVMTAITRDFPGYLAFSVMLGRMVRALVISAAMSMIVSIVSCRGGAGGSQHYQRQSQLTKRFHFFSLCELSGSDLPSSKGIAFLIEKLRSVHQGLATGKPALTFYLFAKKISTAFTPIYTAGKLTCAAYKLITVMKQMSHLRQAWKGRFACRFGTEKDAMRSGAMENSER